jgi:hypothetical protein
MWVFRGSREIILRMREFENAGVGNTLSLEDNRFALEGGVKLLEIEYFPTPKKYKKVLTFHVYNCKCRDGVAKWSSLAGGSSNLSRRMYVRKKFVGKRC